MAALEVMALDHTLEALAAAGPDHVHALTAREHRGEHLLTGLRRHGSGGEGRDGDVFGFFIQPMGLLIPLRRVAAYRDDGWGEFFTHHMLRQLDAERPQEPPKTLTIDVVEPVEPPESPAPVELSAPGRQLTVGDTVRTRTGHVGEVTAINGAHATVWVGSAGAGYETDHLLTSLERVLSTAPPDSLVEPVVTPPAPRPLAVGDRVCSTGPVIVEGVIEVISANRAALRLDNGGMVNRLLGELRRVEGAATVHELQSAPAISRPGVFADLAPLPWTLVKRQILDAKGLPVTSFGLGLDAVAEQVVALINATVGERQPERESI